MVFLLVADRGTAWVLPMVLPAMLVLALDAWGPPRGLRSALVTVSIAALVAASIDVVFNGGVTAGIAATLDPTGRIAGLVGEAARRLRDARVEVLLLALV